jgi:P27 family predicted phage terminase small subunit
MGRKSRPTSIKKLMGEPNKDRINENEPQFSTSGVKPPYHLSDVAKREWARMYPILTASKVMSDADRAALAAYCQNYARWVKAENHVKTHGEVLISEKGYEYQSPWVGMANTAQMQMHKFAVEFGMTPASRTRISVAPSSKETDPMEALFNECAAEHGGR